MGKTDIADAQIDAAEQPDIWNRHVPVEKSAYVQETAPVFFNLDGLRVPDGSLTMLDLFCGAGGFSVGCSWAGFFPVFGIDYLEPAITTWKANHPDSICCLGDIRLTDAETIRGLLAERGVGHINLITGGVPCQGFSIANRKHNDLDNRNFLFLEYMKFVDVFDPDYIILENVSGMRSTAGGQFEKDIKASMESMGYTVTVGMVNAAEYGVPQVRQRLVFVGVKKGRNLSAKYAIPNGKYSSSKSYRTVESAISDLPKLGNNECKSRYTAKPSSEYQTLMRGEGEISIPKPKGLSNHTAPNHPQETVDKIASTKQGQPMYPKFKQRIRLAANAPSPTQLAGGIRPQFQFGHPTQPRGLSIRERARIQSFPDSYVFIGGIVQERVLTGNAVPPLMIYELVKPIAEDIQRKNEESRHMYRVWYSTESFADYIIDHTLLSSRQVVKNKLYESDANNPARFHTMPDHIRKILYLDAPDLIVEKDNEPIFSVEVTTEAGTGHNAFQRFARIAASVENEVPAFYIYPEGVIIKRKGSSPRWDVINPAVFKALDAVMSIYDIPALLYYFPSDITDYPNPNAADAPNIRNKGLQFDRDIVKYSGCPNSASGEMAKMFDALNEVISATEAKGTNSGRVSLLRNLVIRERRDFMSSQFALKARGQDLGAMSPISATVEVPTQSLLNYLSRYEGANYKIGELLRNREKTIIYKVNARFRGDPYPGALAALDYLLCREGKTFEERRNNLVLVFGSLSVDSDDQAITVTDDNGSSIESFFSDVKHSEQHNLLSKDYSELENSVIPRYFMQVRYGSTYSKVKHVRVYSYFADAILFPDGSLWRDA
ncbi:MAG: DNA cytosine methyltransferase [Oscillospiraceae bacterium]|jgi:DNA (cytosine-5)-methyltransferase 1|nr:DNA cytosine methyltransferase [Oscillospiraceae bacterium]